MTSASFDNGMQLIGWNGPAGDTAHPGESLQLTLFWGTTKPVNFDYSAFVRLNNDGGVIVHDTDHGPGVLLDLLPHLWQPGEVIPDQWTIQLPDALPAGDYALEAGLYDYRDSRPILAGQQASIRLGTIKVT